MLLASPLSRLFHIFGVKSQDPKGQMKLERTPTIPASAGDVLAYGVACLQREFLDSSLEVRHFVKGIFYCMPYFFSNIYCIPYS